MKAFHHITALGLALVSGAAAATGISGYHEAPNAEFGDSASYQLTGDTKFGWRTGTVTGALDLNGHRFVLDTGGGNHTVFSGAITGRGSFEWNGGGVPQVAPSVLGGTVANSFEGTFTLTRGVLDLAKPAGTDAIPGDLIVGTAGEAGIRLMNADQIHDSSHVTLGGPEVSRIELQGHAEKIGSLTLKSHAEIIMGSGPAALAAGDSHSREWNPAATLTIIGFKPGKDRIAFGSSERGLTDTQLARIGFDSPEGLAPGLYTAKAGPGGDLSPGMLVRAVNPPFDVSASAAAARTKLWDIPGLDRIGAENSPLRDGLVIDFFGDSITWQNGFVERIGKSIPAGRKVKLINRGINGGGVLQVRDGSGEGAYPGSSAQKPFAEVIAADKADVAVIYIGINDVWWRNTAPDVFERTLRDLISSAKANRTIPVLATLSVRGELPDGSNPDDPKITQYAAITRAVAGDTGTALVDLRSAFVAWLKNHNARLRVDGTLYSKPSGFLTYDGVHPSSHGVTLLANLISDGICRALQPGNAKAPVPAPLHPGEAIDYTPYAFQPESWKARGLSLQMTPWTGEHVVFLTTGEGLDPALMGKWVARLDAGWALYADLTGARPQPHKHIGGKVTIAAVPSGDLTCGAGCGFVGATGIELAMFYDHNYPELKAHPEAMPHYVFYEMGRNYYTFGDRHSCFITGFAVFMRYVCMDALHCGDTEAALRRVIEDVEPRLSGSGLGFLDLFTTNGIGEKENVIRDAAGKIIEPSDQPVRYAAAMLRLRRENGGDAWVKRFYQELSTCPAAAPRTKEGALMQGWHWLLCAGVAAGKDLCPVFTGEWKLPLAEETCTALCRIDWRQPGLTVQKVAASVRPVWKD